MLTAIETGLRWGELVALRPRHIDCLRGSLTVEETIVEVSKKHSPTGERMIVKPYPKDNEPRRSVSPVLLEVSLPASPRTRPRTRRPPVPVHREAGGAPMSRNTFRTASGSPPE